MVWTLCELTHCQVGALLTHSHASWITGVLVYFRVLHCIVLYDSMIVWYWLILYLSSVPYFLTWSCLQKIYNSAVSDRSTWPHCACLCCLHCCGFILLFGLRFPVWCPYVCWSNAPHISGSNPNICRFLQVPTFAGQYPQVVASFCS